MNARGGRRKKSNFRRRRLSRRLSNDLTAWTLSSAMWSIGAWEVFDALRIEAEDMAHHCTLVLKVSIYNDYISGAGRAKKLSLVDHILIK